MEHFPSIECSLLQVLDSMKKSEEERECEAIIRELASRVSLDVVKESLAPYLSAMGQRTTAWHFMEWKASENRRLILAPKDFLALLDTESTQFYRDHVLLKSDVLHIAASTLGQSQNRQWFQERRCRITSSTAHQIKTRRTKLKELAVSMATRQAFSNAATQYGTANESRARDVLQIQLGVPITQDLGVSLLYILYCFSSLETMSSLRLVV
ncbi:uncharacterized protein LOC135394456 [Ornithodoros turicata]|uniref:uncharacterized protein LOC135394456 n=1 Tax=Ornithodoros turicata TaxID=34597 RepID=UPI003139A33D